MITRLYIKDFILIKELELSLQDGFTTITGETGAGKSILVGAIGLILGNRADIKSIREGANKAIIEADCDLTGVVGLQHIFADNDLDFDERCTLRRELTSNGKSRAFINDTPVTTAVMKAVGEHLVDIHSQHHNMLIGDVDYQINVLDTLANNHSLLEEYTAAFAAFSESKQTLLAEQKRIEQQSKEQEFIAFQLEQLDNANLKAGELDQLEERQAMAQHSTEIAEALHFVSSFAEGDEERQGVVEQVHGATKLIGRVAQHYTQVGELHRRLESLEVELRDITREADNLLDNIEVDPQELEQIEQRLDLLQGLLFKFKLTEHDDLITLRDQYTRALEEITNSDERLLQLEHEVQQKLDTATRLAEQLSIAREKSADRLLPPLHKLMSELGIAGATFKADLQRLPQLGANGFDGVQFLFATNKQTTLQPIREIASGGEISRFMLALKTILAEHTVLPTVIFDEIDTGVSGEVAEKLGRVMARLGEHIQVLSITHLPQIAALAKHQLVVAKKEDKDTYFTTIHEVEGEERVRQLATMLTGAEMTDAALANARELLSK
ncbi:DNA repair protein RecN [Porphyromonas levii]|uniref:DNA repair protein RecN n=1 Tax=Porphyromonas levii TaxID=28114 RepID=UPI001B8D67C5|nr:DNA repair protein RecN [Porphyromonas levii]MBR8732313.1 DNA repair protein RecN [Porphyromonas levii]MBR8769493.1 DNA repair protein RecN [Porphyromonas levii]MBR8773976.1 DNA repair protein RecN [Porphyromonas levii]